MTELAPPLFALAPTTTPADQNPAIIYLARLAPGSRRTMQSGLMTIATLLTGGRHDAFSLPWAGLRYQHTQAVRAALAERYAPAMANKLLAALRGVLREAWRLGQIPAEEYHRAVDLTGVKAETLPSGRALTPGEIGALLRVCANDPSAAGARDGALVAVFAGAGLRRAEVAALQIADYVGEQGMLTIRSGKGRKDRMTYLGVGAMEVVADWITVRGNVPGALFCPVDKAGTVTIRTMTAQSLMEALAKRGQQAGLAPFSPHDLRRTFISELLDAGADIATVQKLAGHANVQTTARYDRRGEVAKRKAVGLLHLPHYPREQS